MLPHNVERGRPQQRPADLSAECNHVPPAPPVLEDSQPVAQRAIAPRVVEPVAHLGTKLSEELCARPTARRPLGRIRRLAVLCHTALLHRPDVPLEQLVGALNGAVRAKGTPHALGGYAARLARRKDLLWAVARHARVVVLGVHVAGQRVARLVALAAWQQRRSELLGRGGHAVVDACLLSRWPRRRQRRDRRAPFGAHGSTRHLCCRNGAPRLLLHLHRRLLRRLLNRQRRVNVTVARRTANACELGVVPARPRQMPAAQILLDVRAVLAVALRRLALFDTCASRLRKLPAPERCAIGPLGRPRRRAEAHTIIRATELTEEQVEVAVAHAPLVHVIQPATTLIEAGKDGHLRLVLVVGVGREVGVPELVDNLVADLIVMVACLDSLPAAAVVLHLGARGRAALCLPVGGEAEKPHRRPPTPIGKEIARQQCCEGGGMRVAIVVVTTSTALGACATRGLEQLREERLGGGNQNSCRLAVDRIAPLLQHLLRQQRPHLRRVDETADDLASELEPTKRECRLAQLAHALSREPIDVFQLVEGGPRLELGCELGRLRPLAKAAQAVELLQLITQLPPHELSFRLRR